MYLQTWKSLLYFDFFYVVPPVLELDIKLYSISLNIIGNLENKTTRAIKFSFRTVDNLLLILSQAWWMINDGAIKFSIV